MFMIMNPSKQTIAIGDLNISIAPRKALDLDAMMSRSKSNASADLKMALRQRMLKIMARDEPDDLIEPIRPIVQVAASDSLSADEMRKVVAEEVSKALGKGIPQKNENMQDVLAAIERLAATVGENRSIKQTSLKDVQIDDADADIDDAVLSAMHAKTVNKQVSKTKGTVIYKEEEVSGSISDKLAALDDLL